MNKLLAALFSALLSTSALAQNVTTSGGGGSGTPGGTNGQIQYNNGGLFGGYNIGAGLGVSGSDLIATGTPALPSGQIFVGNASNVPAAVTPGAGLSVAGGTLLIGAGAISDSMLASTFLKINPALGTPVSGVATNLTGTAAGLTAGLVTTNANLTGPITSSGNATAIASQTGTGTKFVVDNGPTLIGPVLGVATGTSLATTGSIAVGTSLSGTVRALFQGADTGSTNFSFYAQNSDASKNVAFRNDGVLSTNGQLIGATSAMFGASVALTLASGEIGMAKITASGSAPGAAGAKFEWVCGTGAGTLKLISYAGTSTTPVTIADNVGGSATGC